MTFSNPAGSAAALAGTYVKALLDLLGDRDPLSVQAELVPALEALTAGLDEKSWRRPESAGKWSIVEVVQHLADSEIVIGYRIRLILSQDRPPIQGFDQDAWARHLGYAAADPETALGQLRAVRVANLALLRTLDAARLDRYGVHSERGPESVRRIAQLTAAHDLVHRRQIERVRSSAD